MDEIELPLKHRNLGVSLGASKMISEPIGMFGVKPSTYLASTLTLSPNGLKRDST